MTHILSFKNNDLISTKTSYILEVFSDRSIYSINEQQFVKGGLFYTVTRILTPEGELRHGSFCGDRRDIALYLFCEKDSDMYLSIDADDWIEHAISLLRLQYTGDWKIYDVLSNVLDLK
jgi:hypothetical protein